MELPHVFLELDTGPFYINLLHVISVGPSDKGRCSCCIITTSGSITVSESVANTVIEELKKYRGNE